MVILCCLKKNGNLRMCIDYRSLNQQTVKNRYPLPRIDDLFDQLQSAKVFSSSDLQSAYYQVRLKPDDVPKTAFTTPLGLYEFRVLRFGLTDAPGTFQNIMNDVLKDVIGTLIIVYLDDIVVHSKDQAEHYKHLQIVLQLLREHELYANLAKCKFVQPELHFLGHIVGAQGLRVDLRRLPLCRTGLCPRTKTRCKSSGALPITSGNSSWAGPYLYLHCRRCLRNLTPLGGMQVVTPHLMASSMLFAMLLC